MICLCRQSDEFRLKSVELDCMYQNWDTQEVEREWADIAYFVKHISTNNVILP